MISDHACLDGFVLGTVKVILNKDVCPRANKDAGSSTALSSKSKPSIIDKYFFWIVVYLSDSYFYMRSLYNICVSMEIAIDCYIGIIEKLEKPRVLQNKQYRQSP